jgi:LPS export ABC transporter protein LptC
MALILKMVLKQQNIFSTVVHKSATYGIMAAVLICGAAAFSSCQKKEEVKGNLVIQDMPAMTSENLKTIYTDNGKTQLIMTAPVVQQFNESQSAKYEFPKGIMVEFYDGNPTPKGIISSHWAHYSDETKIWELRDSVVAINNETGSKLETELLYWSQDKEKVWSDSFVKVTDKDQISMGTGFESDQKLENVKIKNYSGTIFVNNE